MKRLICLGIIGLALAGCAGHDNEAEISSRNLSLPAMHWDDHRPDDQARGWTLAAMAAVQTHGGGLTQTIPKDIAVFCPGYAQGDQTRRAAFWAGLFSALAKHESTWNPAAVGGGGRWFGLVQIAPATARGYGCSAQTGDALKDGSANLACAIRIAAHTVGRDGVVAAGGRGVAADWAPMRNAEKRADMARWTASQSYCRAEGKAS